LIILGVVISLITVTAQLSEGGVLCMVIAMTQDYVNRVLTGWLGGSVVERRSLTGELSLVCTRPAADV